MAGKRPEKKALVRSDFTALLADVKSRIQAAQTRAVLSVNAELVRLYWDVGRIIDERQQREGWGAAVIPRLAKELTNELPELKGFSERNIGRMIAFYREYPDPNAILPQVAAKLDAEAISPPPAAKMSALKKVPQAVARLAPAVILPQAAAKLEPVARLTQPAARRPDSLLWSIPWFHNVVLMEKVKDISVRRWYMEQTLANGWSRSVLMHQIERRCNRPCRRSKRSRPNWVTP